VIRYEGHCITLVLNFFCLSLCVLVALANERKRALNYESENLVLRNNLNEMNRNLEKIQTMLCGDTLPNKVRIYS